MQDFNERQTFQQQKRVLFMPYCEVLAHAGRMLVVAQALREKFSGMIEFAGKGRYGAIFPESGFLFHEMEGGSPQDKPYALYQRRLSLWGFRAFFNGMYDAHLNDINNEIELYKRVKPDLVVWDARFTVPISAEIYGVPIISVMQTYGMFYSPVRLNILRRNPIFVRYPWLLFVARLPKTVQEALSDALSKLLSSLLLRYANRVWSAYGLAPLTSLPDLLEKLQTTLIPEVETSEPTADLPANFHRVGPLVWEPQMEVPLAIKDLQDIIYVSMGSTGSPETLKLLIEASSQMQEFQIVITTGNLIDPASLGPLPENVYLYRFLPWVEMAKRTRLVICHGGVGTIAQALSQGVPIIGIPFNMTQEVEIDRTAAVGAGIKLDLATLTPQKIRQAVGEVLARQEYRTAAASLVSRYTLKEGPLRAAEIILRQLGSQTITIAKPRSCRVAKF